MEKFPLNAHGYDYRPLKLADPHLSGWDVFALQTGLNAASGPAIGPTLVLDGVLGKKTAQAIEACQVAEGLDPDGVAGVITQRAIAIEITRLVPDQPAPGLLKGQLEHESSFWLGNYTAAYPDGSRDCGVAQRNTNYTHKKFGFDVADSVEDLAKHLIDYELKYGSVVGQRRRWELAAGAWNAPAYTDALARGADYAIVSGQRIDLTPGAPARVKIEAYMSACTVYLP